MRIIIIIVMLFNSFIGFNLPQTEIESNYKYYSDYFVFISNPDEQRIIIPIDINWEKNSSNTIFREIKAWIGLEDEWIYEGIMDTVRLNSFPEDWYEVPYFNNISWEISETKTKFILFNPGGTEQYIELYFEQPDPFSISDNSSDRGIKTTSARNAYIVYKNNRINGTLIHEYIRSYNLGKQDDPVSPNRFGEFSWIPLLDDENVFLFITRNTSQILLYWKIEDGKYLFNSNTDTYDYEVTLREHENISNRNNIPVSWNIHDNDLNFEIILEGKAHHTGYGDLNSEFPPLYRQQLVSGIINYDEFSRPIYGMAEIILDE